MQLFTNLKQHNQQQQNQNLLQTNDNNEPQSDNAQ